MTINELRKKCYELELEGKEILDKYTDEDLEKIYNGIGPDAFPDWVRDFITELNPSLAPVALIHDVEWHESDGTEKTFHESNFRFRRNGNAVAKTYAWYCLRRYIVWNHTRLFYKALETIFGKLAWKEAYQKRERRSCA